MTPNEQLKKLLEFFQQQPDDIRNWAFIHLQQHAGRLKAAIAYRLTIEEREEFTNASAKLCVSELRELLPPLALEQLDYGTVPPNWDDAPSSS